VPAGVPIITRDAVARAKPDSDLLLAADALDLPVEDCIVVGDSVWDLLAARRARALGVGLLSGGYGTDELERAGAFRSTRTRRTCSGTSTRWVSANSNDAPTPPPRAGTGERSGSPSRPYR
jgi:beta-phosphoglucomutase-like phosphatase (HAD superfamily)